MSDINDKPQEASEAPPPAPPQNQGIDQRRRLRELLSIPESQRSDAVWDEIIELEIQLAPGNRLGGAPGKSGGERQGPAKQGGGAPGAGGSNNWKRHGPGRKHPKAGGGKKPGGPQGGPPPAA